MAGSLGPGVIAQLFSYEERVLLMRFQRTHRIYVLDPVRQMVLRSLHDRGYCKAFAGQGSDAGVLIADVTPAGLAAGNGLGWSTSAAES